MCTGASPGSKMATEIRQQTISWNHPREAIGRSAILVRSAAWEIPGRYHVASVLKAVRNMLPTDVRDAADSFRYMQSAHQSRPTPNPTKRGSGRPASAQSIASNSASLLSSNLFRCSMPSLSRRGGGSSRPVARKDRSAEPGIQSNASMGAGACSFRTTVADR